MGNLNSGKRIYNSNNKFFREWNPNMAYLLGFTCADGCVYKGTLSWELSNKFPSDQSLLEEFSRVLNSNYQIEERPKSYRLRINSLFLIKDLEKLGIVPNKTKILNFPKIPNNLLRHFIRGFLDGDGWIINKSHKNGRKEICVGFSNGSYKFMKNLVIILKLNVGIKKFNLRKRMKLTKRGVNSCCYQLEFYSDNAFKLIKFLYDDLDNSNLYLIRKYESQMKARQSFDKTSRAKLFGNKWLNIEQLNKGDMERILVTLLNEGLIPREIAEKFNISLSTLYRWLDKSKVRFMVKRGSKEWTKRILTSKSKIECDG